MITKRIVFVCSHFSGGARRSMLAIAKGLETYGYECLVLSKREPHSLPEVDYIEGIKVIRYVPQTSNFKSAITDIVTRHSSDLSSVSSVHSFGAFFQHNRYAIELSKYFNVPLHCTFIGMDAYNVCNAIKSRTPRFQIDELITMKESQTIVFCSNALMEMVSPVMDEELKNKCRVIYMGVDRDLCTYNQVHMHDKPYILTLARLSRKKGCDLGIQAFSNVARQRKNIDYLIAGSGDEYQALQQQIRELELEDRIKLLNECDRPTVSSLLRSCELVLVPSREEAFGLVTLESMIFKKPIVAFNIGGLSEAIKHGCNGYLVDPWDTMAMAQYIIDLLDSSKSKKEMGQNGFNYARNFSWENTIKAYIQSCNL